MKTSTKAGIVVGGIVCALAVTVTIVRAAELGTDFSWLSTSINGIRIGAPGTGTPPASHTLEFTTTEGEALHHVTFNDAAEIAGTNRIFSAVVGLSDNEGEGEPPAIEPQSAVLISAQPAIETLSAGLVTQSGDAGIATGHVEGSAPNFVFVPHAAVLCTDAGDVVVQLGEPQTSQMQSAMSTSGDSATVSNNGNHGASNNGNHGASNNGNHNGAQEVQQEETAAPERVKFNIDPSLFNIPPSLAQGN